VKIVGNITKFGIERLDSRNLLVEMDCPNCGTARIEFYSDNGSGIQDVTCYKCHVNIILDTLNLTVVNEARPKDN